MGSFVDRRGNHVEMGLHVFFGCYNNLFRLMKKVSKGGFRLQEQFVLFWDISLTINNYTFTAFITRLTSLIDFLDLHLT